MPWIREGECPPERCGGRCCEHIGLWFDDTPEARSFLETVAVRGVKVSMAGGKHLVDLHQRCQYLTKEGLCSLHPSMNPGPSLPERPSFCEEWPTEPSQLLLHPYCGFTWRWEEEKTEVLQGER